jgi:hypothetical protein
MWKGGIYKLNSANFKKEDWDKQTTVYIKGIKNKKDKYRDILNVLTVEKAKLRKEEKVEKTRKAKQDRDDNGIDEEELSEDELLDPRANLPDSEDGVHGAMYVD